MMRGVKVVTRSKSSLFEEITRVDLPSILHYPVVILWRLSSGGVCDDDDAVNHTMWFMVNASSHFEGIGATFRILTPYVEPGPISGAVSWCAPMKTGYSARELIVCTVDTIGAPCPTGAIGHTKH